MKLSVDDMNCGHCTASIQTALKRLDPRAKITTDLDTRTVELDTVASQPDVVAALAAIGFEAKAA